MKTQYVCPVCGPQEKPCAELAEEYNAKFDLSRWLENHGSDLLRWDRGTIVIESFYEKQFRALGGDLNRLIACFEDNGEMSGAIEEYMRERA